MKKTSRSRKTTKTIENNDEDSVITKEVLSQLYEINSTNNINKNDIPIIKLLILHSNSIKKSDYQKLVNVLCSILNNTKNKIENYSDYVSKCICNEILNVQKEIIYSEISMFINNIKPFCDTKYDIVNQSVNLNNYYMIDKYGIVIKYKEYNTNDVYSWTYDIKHDPISIFITSGKENKKNKTYNALTKQYKLRPELFTASRSVINILYSDNDKIRCMIDKIIAEN